ncbi:MAG: nucleoside-diphosphate kinase [candidate division Zixibacteria bacterium]|nr:nucleoside-diphosphate kinase [candidate division Zixibacteria bacterium]
MKHTLMIIKPDASSRNLIGEIIRRIEQSGFVIRAMRLETLSPDRAKAFYAVHKERPFYESLCRFMSSGPIVPMVLEKENAVDNLRTLIGATNPKEAACGTLRYDLAVDVEKNSVHASDSPENARKEIAFFFEGIDLD